LLSSVYFTTFPFPCIARTQWLLKKLFSLSSSLWIRMLHNLLFQT
jgi:hypothetical protein